MPWNVKPSATTRIQQPPKPYLTKEMRDRYAAEILPRYEKKQGALMPILNDVQHRYRCVPPAAMVEIAQFLEITPADVLDTASFYEEYTTEPTGEFVIAICQSLACELCEHGVILDHLRRKLDVEPHETTDDGRFTLLTLECLGSCDTAPVALVNETLYENLTIEKIDKIIDGLPAKAPTATMHKTKRRKVRSSE